MLRAVAALLILPLLSCDQLATALEQCEPVSILYDTYFSISFQDPDDSYEVSFRNSEGDIVKVENVRKTTYLWGDPSFDPDHDPYLKVRPTCSGCITPTTRLIMEIVVNDDVVAKDSWSILEDGDHVFTTPAILSYDMKGCGP